MTRITTNIKEEVREKGETKNNETVLKRKNIETLSKEFTEETKFSLAK